MGSNCMASTPNQSYSSYLAINSSELKDLWETAKIVKIKQIYRACSKAQQIQNQPDSLSFHTFIKMFPELQRYDQIHKKRLFDIFDSQNQGFLNWNSFFTTISICYFAPQQILSVFLFMIFDEALVHELNKDQVKLLVQRNSFALKPKNQLNSDLELEKIVEELLDKKLSISINRWQEQAKNFFDFSKYRRLFNIFKEQKLEKELILNFNNWNKLYNEQTKKYVSYVVCYKWFQSWRIYVEETYGVTLNLNSRKQSTKSLLKSKKTFHNNLKKTNKKIATSKTYKIIQTFTSIEEKDKNEDDKEEFCSKNIDFIHCNIGERPRKIYNTALQGQFQQVLKPELVENKDYILVSQHVWTLLMQVYGGGPEFRRTGFECVELYPKVVKIYSSLFYNQIDYSSQVIREVSSDLTVQELFTRSIQIQKQQLQKKVVYFKTIGMMKWEKITDLDEVFSQLTADTIIFMIYIDASEEQKFKKNHAKSISQINAGDYLIYVDPKTKIERQAVFLGKNVEGKYIIHFPKESYSFDKCLVESDVVDHCKVYSSQTTLNQVKLKGKNQLEFKGISNGKGLGFINSTILNLFNNQHFKNIISMMTFSEEDPKMLHFLKSVNQNFFKKKVADPRDIHDMVELFFPKFQSFEVSMSEDFLRDFYAQLISELRDLSIEKKVEDSLKIQTKTLKRCLNCNLEQSEEFQDYCISIPLPWEQKLIYEIVFVPICTGLKSQQIKKYGIKLSSNATLRDLKHEFQLIAELNSKRSYILAEVYSNRIIKNYHEVQLDTPLQKLKLRSDGESIYAFELYVNFSKFVSNCYPVSKGLSMKDIKIDGFVDCNHNQKGWILGKICQVQYLPYTHQTLVKAVHKFSEEQEWHVNYDLNEDRLDKFLSKCYRNAQQYHVQMVQKYFNESINEMQICHMPLVIAITNWMRWKQFTYLVYLQLKRFIGAAHEFENFNDEDLDDYQNMELTSCKDNLVKSSKKIINSVKKNKFKQYLNSPSFPYTIHFTDFEGRCAICFRFFKTIIFKGESEKYCEGCPLSQSDPITWQIKISDIVVCINWKDFGWWKTELIQLHSSLINLLHDKKKQVSSLQSCIKSLFEPSIQQLQIACCNLSAQFEIRKELIEYPEIFTIFISRIKEYEDGYKKINKNSLTYPLKNLKIGKSLFNLSGVTSIEQNSQNIKYKTYIKRQQGGLVAMREQKEIQQWIQFDGQHSKIVPAKTVENTCAMVLFYKKQVK